MGLPTPWISCFDGSETRQCLRRGSQFWNFENWALFRSSRTFFGGKVLLDQKRPGFQNFKKGCPSWGIVLSQSHQNRRFMGFVAPFCGFVPCFLLKLSEIARIGVKSKQTIVRCNRFVWMLPNIINFAQEKEFLKNIHANTHNSEKGAPLKKPLFLSFQPKITKNQKTV